MWEVHVWKMDTANYLPQHRERSSAQPYDAQNKGVALLQWGYASGRLKLKPLNEGIFNTILSMQKQSKANDEVQDAMQFFGLASAADFETMRCTVSQVMPELVTEHGTWAARVGPLHGCQMTWPSLFVHVYEAKQLLIKFGQQLCIELLATRWYVPMKVLKAVVGPDPQEGESSQLCCCIRLAQLQMDCVRRYKSKMRKRFTTKAAGTKRGPAMAPETPSSKARKKKLSSEVESPQPSKKANSPQPAVLPMPAGEETGHGSSANTPSSPTSSSSSPGQSTLASPAASVALPCDCSGNCAGGKPCCPSRRRWSTTRKQGRCPNPAEKIDEDAVRHFCRACRCVAPGCSWPRRRGPFCGRHNDDFSDTAKLMLTNDEPLGWYRIAPTAVGHDQTT